MLSSHLFLCLPCLLPPFTVPCKMVLARLDEWETWPYHCSLRLFTMVGRSSCGPIACWALAQTSLLVTWSLYEMHSEVRLYWILNQNAGFLRQKLSSVSVTKVVKFLLHLHPSLNCRGCWGTTVDSTTSSLHFSLFSTALWNFADSRPIHSLMLSSHLFFCLPCLLTPLTLPCKIVSARPDEQETCPYHFSLHLFTMVRRYSCLLTCEV